jgi:hypothetical protein
MGRCQLDSILLFGTSDLRATGDFGCPGAIVNLGCQVEPAAS